MVRWPNGAKCAATMTVHFDAETLWTSKDERHRVRPVLLSQGGYGARRGVDALLDLLDEFGFTTTFFVPGVVAETHAEVVRRIVDHGHALGHHGYEHERLRPMPVEDETAILTRGLDALLAVSSVPPRGYCAPGWEVTGHTLHLLASFGFDYSTNFMDDVHPYVHDVRTGDPAYRLVELPVHWLLDDAPFRLGGDEHRKPISSAQFLYELWLEEFEGIHDAGGLFNLTVHPQVSGRPSMIRVLRRLLGEIRDREDVWLASCEELADHVRTDEGARAPRPKETA